MPTPALRRIIVERFPYGSFKYVGGDINTVKEFSMKKKLIIGAFVVCLLAFVAVMAFSQSSTNVRWEYTIRNTGNFDMIRNDGQNVFTAVANELGQQGWELISVTRTDNVNNLIFKRRLP
jgi:hypothetical protein